MRKLSRKKLFKPCAAALLVVVLVCSFVLPAFAITPTYVSNKDNPYYSIDFVEESLTRRLVQYYDYSMNNMSSWNAVDKKFANAFYPSHTNYYTNGDFDSLLKNAFSFCAGEELAQVSQWQGYRFISYDPIRRGTSYTFVVAKSPVWTTAQFTLETVALGRAALRFKQTNTNTSADGGKRRFAIYNVFFPRTWSGGTTGVVCTKQTIVDNAYPTAGTGWAGWAPYVFAAENLLWMDNAALTLFGSRTYTNLNMFYSDSVWMDCICPHVFGALTGSTSQPYMAADMVGDRLASEGQYYIDFEFYYSGLSVSDDFLLALIKAANPIRFSKCDDGSSFSAISYELLQSSQRSMTSGGETCYFVTFRCWFQPPSVSLTAMYQFNIVWFEHLFWSTPLDSNKTYFRPAVTSSDGSSQGQLDVTQMWSRLTKSVDFARMVVQQLWLAMPSEVYSLLVIALYLIIALAVVRLVL